MGFQIEHKIGEKEWSGGGPLPFGSDNDNNFATEAEAAQAADSLTYFCGLEWRVKPASEVVAGGVSVKVVDGRGSAQTNGPPPRAVFL